MREYTSIRVRGKRHAVAKFRDTLQELVRQGDLEIAYDSQDEIRRGFLRFSHFRYFGIFYLPSPAKFSLDNLIVEDKQEGVNLGRYEFQTEEGSLPEFKATEVLLRNIRQSSQIPHEVVFRVSGDYNERTILRPRYKYGSDYRIVGSFEGDLEGVLYAANLLRQGRIGCLKIAEEMLQVEQKSMHARTFERKIDN